MFHIILAVIIVVVFVKLLVLYPKSIWKDFERTYGVNYHPPNFLLKGVNSTIYSETPSLDKFAKSTYFRGGTDVWIDAIGLWFRFHGPLFINSMPIFIPWKEVKNELWAQSMREQILLTFDRLPNQSIGLTPKSWERILVEKGKYAGI